MKDPKSLLSDAHNSHDHNSHDVHQIAQQLQIHDQQHFDCDDTAHVIPHKQYG